MADHASDDTRGDPLGLGFLPGESPFEIKGVAYLGHMEYVRDNVPGGVDAMLAEFETDAMRDFFAQRFLASRRYDIAPLIAAGATCADLLGLENAEFLKRRTQAQAHADVGGIYRFLLKLISSRLLAKRLPLFLGQYFNFGTTTTEIVRRGTVRAHFTGVPQAFVPWFCAVMGTYAEVVMQLSGATQVASNTSALPSDTAATGVRTCTVVLDLIFDSGRDDAESEGCSG